MIYPKTNETNTFKKIEGFYSGSIYPNIYFYVSEETIKWSNSQFPDSYVKDILNLFIKPKLERQEINTTKLLDNITIIVAHGRSDKKEWRVFGKKEDNKGLLIEDFLSKLPKNRKILLYVCNSGGYKLDEGKYKIIYPKTNTGVENLEFYISKVLLNIL